MSREVGRGPRPAPPGAALVIGLVLASLVAFPAGCGGGSAATPQGGTAGEAHIAVIVVENFLADITRNVAGEEMVVESLVPMGVDPHAFEFTPATAAKVANCDVLIMNGGGLEVALEDTVRTLAKDVLIVEASAGLTSRTAGGEGEPVESVENPEGEEHALEHGSGDPHFWLDPLLTVKYVENIRDGLTQADPAGGPRFSANAAAYIESLRELHAWIEQQTSEISPAERLLITNHESFGYFADRYGFQIVGTIIPSVSANASSSAQQMARLVDLIRKTGVRAIFVETGSNPRPAELLASETGVRVITKLYTHSLTAADGPAPTYIDMMRANTRTIVEALR